MSDSKTVRNVVITGASTGIGAATAVRLAGSGWRVFAGVRQETDGDRLREQAPDAIVPLILEVTSTQDIRKAADCVRTEVGERGIQGLVNNAGIAVPGPLEFIPINEIRQQLEVNVLGQIAVTQAFLSLVRAGRGRLVNVGSVGGRIALPFVGPYAASKFAIEAISDVFRVELSSWKIPVSVIEAGAIDTPMWSKSLAHADKMIAAMPEEAHRLYGPLIEKARTRSQEMASEASPAEPVAAVIEHALTVARPKTRYRVGKHAVAQHIVGRYFPDRLRDFCVRLLLGI